MEVRVFSTLLFDVSHNCGHSKNGFWGVFRSQKDTFRSQIADRFRGVLRYPIILSRFASRVSITHQPKRLVKNRPNPTENRPTLTENRPDATFSCHFATLLRHFVHNAKVDLRRIACDFLTSRNRVGVGDGFLSSFRRAVQ